MMNGKTLSAAFELKSNDSLRLDLLHHLYCEKENWWNSAGLTQSEYMESIKSVFSVYTGGVGKIMMDVLGLKKA